VIRWPPAPLGSDCLRGVFDNRNLKFLCDARESVHIGALAIEMNGRIARTF